MKVFDTFSLSKNILPDFINNWSVAQKAAAITSIALTALLAVAALYFFIFRKPSGGPPPGGGPGGGGGLAYAPKVPNSTSNHPVQPNYTNNTAQPTYTQPAYTQPAYTQPWQGVTQPHVQKPAGTQNIYDPFTIRPRKYNQQENDLVASQLNLQELDQEVWRAKDEYQYFHDTLAATKASALQTPPVSASESEDEDDQVDLKNAENQKDADKVNPNAPAKDSKEDKATLPSENGSKAGKKKPLASKKELDPIDFDKDEKELSRLKAVLDKKFGEFKKSFHDYLEDLSGYIHGCVKSNNVDMSYSAAAQSKNANFNKERSHEIFGHVVTFTGFINAYSEDQSFLQESLYQIDEFLEKTFFTNPNQRCLNEKMKMDLIVFQEFFTLVNSHFDQIKDLQLARRLKIKLANFPLNDCGENPTVKRSDFPKICLTEKDQIDIMIDHFTSFQHPKSFEAIDLLRKVNCVPRWYHATKPNYILPIIQSQNIAVNHKQAFKGAWISNQWELSFGSCIFVFSNKITEIDGGKVFIGFEKGETNWRGLQQPIPLINNFVYFALDDYSLYNKNTYVSALENIGIQNPIIISNQLLNFIQKEMMKVLGNPNLNANWWGAADFKHLEITPAGIADNNETYKV